MEKLVKGLAHVAYHVSDMEASLKFYCDCLGFEKMFEMQDDDGKDWLVYLRIADRQFLELFYGGENDFTINMGKHICLEVSDADALTARIRECGYEMINHDMDPVDGKDNNRETFVQDPDGNLIELMQYGPKAMQFER